MNIDSSLLKRVLDQAIAIQQIPAPTFLEAQRAVFIRDGFVREGLLDVQIDEVGNVYGCLPGQQSQAALVVSAHTDTVFPPATNLAIHQESGRISGPGIGDNSLGVAGLFGLLWVLRQQQTRLPGDLWLVANVGEEGLGDLCGMKAVVDRFGSSARAYLIIEGLALGQIYHRGLGVQRFQISAHTPGGHSWVDFGRPSAIHELALLITLLTKMKIPHQPRTSLNVGVIKGGTSINTIAAEATMELDLRSESERVLHGLVERVQELVNAANRSQVRVTMQPIGSRPVGKLPIDHPLVSMAKDCLQAIGIKPNLSIGSTDANIPLSRGLPAICIGLTTGQGAHTVKEFIHTEPLALGLVQLISLVHSIYAQL